MVEARRGWGSELASGHCGILKGWAFLVSSGDRSAGKVADVWRTTTEGFAKGHFDVSGLEAFQGQALRVQFQNENLVAHVDGLLAACVPDLICCVESASEERPLGGAPHRRWPSGQGVAAPPASGTPG